MITPSLGRALWAGRMEPAAPSLDPAVIEHLIRALKRIESLAELGSYAEVKRELEALSPAARELPTVQLCVGRMLESLARVDEALALYSRMDRSVVSQLGCVRCLARLEQIDEAQELLDQIPFDAALVREFVEARDLVRSIA